MIRQRGERYERCSFETYEQYDPRQMKVVTALTDYAASIAERVAGGQSVVLFGPSGTGKDHLVMSLARCALRAEVEVSWSSGGDLYARARECMATGTSDRKLMIEMSDYEVLYVSDPVPPFADAAASAFQAGFLGEIIDRRHNRNRPTWLTLNVASGNEADQRLGAATVDRLQERTLGLFCDWPSFRERVKRMAAKV